MTPYKLITGTDTNLADFEAKISAALLDGYDLANDLVAQVKTNPNGTTETLLFQALICDEALEYEEEDEENEEEVDEFEEEDEEELS